MQAQFYSKQLEYTQVEGSAPIKNDRLILPEKLQIYFEGPSSAESHAVCPHLLDIPVHLIERIDICDEEWDVNGC